MKGLTATTFCLLWLALCGATLVAQTPRLAVVELNGDDAGAIAAQLRALAKSQFELLDPALVRAAAQGAGYSGSLNLRREEARALGLSIGCDFYVFGKVDVGPRQGEDKQSHFEALAGLFAVETRTGALASFTFIRERAADEIRARAQLTAALPNAWQTLTQAMNSARDRHQDAIAEAGRTPQPVIEVLNDDQLGQQGALPVFYQRLKPEYTAEAEAAGITATVELEAVFQADGKVGDVTVVRWAGFGLDESAIATVRQLRFKPARILEKDGEKEVTLRGLVRYTFRRSPPLAERVDETERLKRSLRELTTPTIKRPPPLHP